MRLRDFVGIIRELSFSEIRHEAMIPPSILVLAPTTQLALEWRNHLFGDESSPFVEVAESRGGDVDPLAFDAMVTIGPLDRGRARKWTELFRRADQEMVLVEINPHQSTSEESLHWLRRKLCDLRRDRSVAFGRYIEQMRTAATSEVVADTSRVNAQFAALSNIPALIPLFGTILAAGADFLVLTKNQLMMMYRVAAIYDRDLNNQWRIYSELAPVVGAGLVWRTVARQVAAVLPLALGAVPKVTIAYAGTYAVGKAACVYYEHGEKLTNEELDDVYREALHKLRNIRHLFGREPRDANGMPELPATAGSSNN